MDGRNAGEREKSFFASSLEIEMGKGKSHAAAVSGLWQIWCKIAIIILFVESMTGPRKTAVDSELLQYKFKHSVLSSW